AGATARHMLVEAAAKRWDVPVSKLKTENGTVFHQESGRKLSYGDLAQDAAGVQVPAEVKLKDRKDFKIIGTPVRNVDNKAMFTGKPLYGLDFYREGMLHAMIQRPPFGMKLKSVETEAAKAVSGVVAVLQFKNNVAVLGEATWPIMKARKLLKIEYVPENEVESSADHNRLFKELLENGEAEVM